MQVKLRRQFWSQISWPLFQFVAALGVISLLIWIRGMLPGMADFTGFNLKGGGGALTFLASVAAFISLLIGGYLFMKNVLQKGPLVDGFLLQIPVLGRCLEAFALARFAMGLHLTQEAGTPMNESLRLSLNATNNAAFAAQHERIAKSVDEGNELAFALREAHLFPDDFLMIVENAELTGQIPEVMRKQALHYHEEASRRLAILTTVAARLVYALVAVFIIFAIYRIYSSAFQQRDQLLRDLNM
jgi:type IV pilus assembly protein PilC